MVLSVDCFVLDARYASNCWVIHTHENPWAVVIDPGGDPALLGENGVETAAILVTHADVDHIGGVAELAEWSGADVWMPTAEADALRRGVTRGGAPVRPYDPEHLVSGGDVIEIAGLSFDVVDVPGHSSGHVAYYSDGRLFSGDLLFEQSVGRVDLPGGDWQALPARRPTWSTKRCTPSATAPTGRSRSAPRARRRSCAPTSSTACTASPSPSRPTRSRRCTGTAHRGAAATASTGSCRSRRSA